MQFILANLELSSATVIQTERNANSDTKLFLFGATSTLTAVNTSKLYPFLSFFPN
jgi:hypothetical protein